jgi:WD40 repeat protein
LIKEGITQLAVSADGRLLAAGSENGRIELWDLDTRKPLGELIQAHAGAVNALAFSHDSQSPLLASGGQDGTLVLINPRDSLTQTLPAQTSPINALDFSPDGANLAVVAFDRRFEMLDLKTRTWVIVGGRATSRVVFNPADGGRTLFVPQLGRTTLWDWGSNQEAASQLEGNTQGLFEIAFSPDGKWMAASACAERDRGGACASAEIRVWDLPTRRAIVQLPVGRSDSPRFFFDKTGAALLAVTPSSSGNGVRLIHWNLDRAEWKQIACRIANRNLTRDEWRIYVDADDTTFRATCENLPP